MTTYFPPICLGCKHFQKTNDETGTCTAFPGGIPLAIWRCKNDHRQPFQGDHDIQFESKDADAADYAQTMFDDDAE